MIFFYSLLEYFLFVLQKLLIFKKTVFMSGLLAVIVIVVIVYFLFRNVNKSSSNKDYERQGRRNGGNYGRWIGGGLGWAFGGPLGAIIGFAIGSAFGNKDIHYFEEPLLTKYEKENRNPDEVLEIKMHEFVCSFQGTELPPTIIDIQKQET